MGEAVAGRVLVLGVGNPGRGDDGAGRAVAQALRGALPRAIEVAEADGEATDILARLDGASAAFLIDGTVHRFDVSEAPLPQGAFGVSTHGFGLHEAIELARALGQLPSHCVVYAIEGASFETGAPQSPLVAGAVVEVASRLSAEIREEQAHA